LIVERRGAGKGVVESWVEIKLKGARTGQNKAHTEWLIRKEEREKEN
jgi:hypothetical protein